MASLQPGTLQSSTRKGLRSFLRRQSLHSDGAAASSSADRACLKRGRQSGQPRELTWAVVSVTFKRSNKRAQQKNQFHIRVRRRDTENLRIDLVELTVAPFLGPFPAEHGADGVEFSDGILSVHLVLDVGAADGCSRLGPQGQQGRLCGPERCTSPFPRYPYPRRCFVRTARSFP
jgi:hypothetical protein